jgi:phosphate transport system protein
MENGRKGIFTGLKLWQQPAAQAAVPAIEAGVPSPIAQPRPRAAPQGRPSQGDAMNEHIVKSYEDELALLDKKIAHMGGLAERILGQAFDALERRDPKLAEVVVRSDKSIDALEREIEEQVVSMIARRQPMADDLRHVMAALRITTDLERVGDLAKNIAKRALAIAHEAHPKPLMSGLRHMGELALTQLKEVLDAYAERDAERALTVWREDENIDAMYNSLFRELLTYMMEDPRNIGISTHLLFGAKNIERVGDHTTNIAETIHFLVRGVNIADDRPKGDETSTTLFQKD